MRYFLVLAFLFSMSPMKASGAMSNAPPPQTILTGAEWVVSTIDGKPPASRRPPSLTVAADGKLSGFSGCNRYFGAARFDGPDAIAVSPIGQTKMACAPEAMATEAAFTKALAGAKRWALAGSILTIEGSGGSLVLKRA
jgi:heat shock protein HslJ